MIFASVLAACCMLSAFAQNEDGQTAPAQRTAKAGGAMFLRGAAGYYWNREMANCRDMGIASGDIAKQQRCEDASTNAGAYLVNMAYSSPLPDTVWSMCASRWTISLDLGARCIAAATEICPVTPEGEAVDFPTCYRIMQGAAWTANPTAHALNFNSK